MNANNPLALIHPKDRRAIRAILKFCPGCSRMLLHRYFGKNKTASDGMQQRCFECRHKYQIENKKLISQKNKARYSLDPKKWIARTAKYRKLNPICRKAEYWRNRDKQLSSHKIYYKENRDRLIKKAKDYVKRNADKRRAYIADWVRNKRRTDPHFRIRNALYSRMYYAAKNQGASKSNKMVVLLGCSIFYFRSHLEKQFRDGMTWENHGPVWHIDHKKPCSKFNLVDPEQQKECFHFSNLQPLLAKENLSKWAHYPYQL